MWEVLGIIAAGGMVAISTKKLGGKSSGGTSDVDKLQKIFTNAGLNRGGQTFDLQNKRRNKEKGYWEYVYRIPLGLSFKQDILPHKQRFQDGINVNTLQSNFKFSDIFTLKIDKTIIKQIRKLLKKERKRKELSFSYDGCLKIRIYDEPLTTRLDYTDDMKKGKWVIPIGIGEDRSIIYFDFDEHYQLIVAGAPGFGKTEFMKLCITLLIDQNPEHVHFHLVDLKEGIGFNRFKDLKQVEEMAETTSQGLQVMRNLQATMTETLQKVKELGKDNVKDAGIKDRQFLIIDEGASIASDKEGAAMLEDIARRGRAAGVYIIYSTQYPTNQSLPSQVRQMSNARLCYRLKTDTASMAVLDEPGAESLPEDIRGRAIFQITSSQVVQTVYMQNDVIKEKIKVHMRGAKDAKDDSKDSTGGKRPLHVEKV
jgi:FtsK/SpoIIIE family